jgi:hypothetical protein
MDMTTLVGLAIFVVMLAIPIIAVVRSGRTAAQQELSETRTNTASAANGAKGNKAR